MPAWRWRRLAFAPLATLLVLVMAGQALGLTWAAAIPLTTNRNGVMAHGTVAASGSTAHAVYEQAIGGIRQVWYRRSTDGGLTWLAPVRLSGSTAVLASQESVTARGANVHAVWLELDDADHSWVRTRRSTDGGATWSAISTLSPTSGYAGIPRIERDALNHVYVTWTDQATGSVRLRTSTDGGATWPAAVEIGKTTSQPYGNGNGFEAFPVLAAGTGIVHLVYYGTIATIDLKRTANGGTSWVGPGVLETSGSGFAPSLAASGTSVVLGYAIYKSGDQYAVVKRSVDSGAHWSSAIPLSAAGGAWEYQPVVSVAGTTWRAVLEADANVAGTASAVWYRQSTDGGASWSTSVKVSTSTRPYAAPGGVTYAGRTIVAYWDNAPDVLDSDVFVRTGS